MEMLPDCRDLPLCGRLKSAKCSIEDGDPATPQQGGNAGVRAAAANPEREDPAEEVMEIKTKKKKKNIIDKCKLWETSYYLPCDE